MSPFSSRCVGVSTNPGSTVAFDRSITSAPAGAVPPALTETIRSPSIKISAFVKAASLFPSINRPARIATFLAAVFSLSCACAVPLNANQNPSNRDGCNQQFSSHQLPPRTPQRVAQMKKGQPSQVRLALVCSGRSQNLFRSSAPSRNLAAAAVAAPSLPPPTLRAAQNSLPGGCYPQLVPLQLPSPSAACTSSQSQTRWPRTPAQTTQTPPPAPAQNRAAALPEPPGTTTSTSARCPWSSFCPLCPFLCLTPTSFVISFNAYL